MNVVITGASRGLGYAIAEKFAAAGDAVFLCARNGAILEAAAQKLGTQFPATPVHYQAADLSQRDAVKSFALTVLDSFVPDVLVNNAGSFEMGSVHNEEEGALERMMATNLYSAYHLSRALLPAMLKRGSGHIFNMCSIASLKAYPNGGAYSISKFALYGFSQNLRDELKHKGIKVTSVLPGAAYTDSWATSGVAPERIMEAGDIAELVYAATHLSAQACVEDILVRPLQGDL